MSSFVVFFFQKPKAWKNNLPHNKVLEIWTLEESVKLIEAGFQYVCDYEKGKIFRKPK